MSDAEARRPDPDRLLAQVTADEARERRGRLRIFFGAAPGVGKTYRMLQVARELFGDQHLDVVVGLVETHRRWDTTSLTLGLEMLPRRLAEHRGRSLEELDLDAAVARKPGILLVDELAHTNAPGSRHAKRWQDVLELLDAGIDVFTTLNVQHLESVNDVVEQITGVQVRETIPDSVLDRADQIEVVDISPDELLERLREGKVYLPEQARRAADHFFKKGNLLALRELALRVTAQHVDADVREYRTEHGVSATWPAGERILVCLGPSPNSARLVRAGARMAAGLRCPWGAAWVDAAPLGLGREEDAARLESHLRLVESLGGTVRRLTGTRIADAVLEYARAENVTRIIVGKPTHPRWRDRLRGSLLDELVRGSGDIDVHVITGDPEAAPAERSRARRPGPPTRVGPWLAAAGIVGVTTGFAAALRALWGLPDAEMLFLLAVMVSALRFGRGPSILAAALSVASYDFFFVPPFFTFAVADGRYALTFAMMFVVGLLLSELVARLRRQEQAAVAREHRTSALYDLSRDLGRAPDAREVAQVVCRHAARVFGAKAHVLAATPGGELEPLASSHGDAAAPPKELSVARWALEHGLPTGAGTDTLPGAEVTCVPLAVGGRAMAVLSMEPGDPTPATGDREYLAIFGRQAAFAFERARLAEDARASAVRAKTEEMRSSLLSAVSHDLRTPLGGITGAATSLRDDEGLSDATRRELTQSICDEAERLERLVGNLLDMTRLEAGAVKPRREWVPLEEIVVSALARLELRLGRRAVQLAIPAELPLLSADPVLLEQLFVNLLENVAKYAPPEAPVEISATETGRGIAVDVADRGPGLPPGGEERIFEKFFRGAHAGVPGVGLGLPICRAIAEVHGGSVHASNREGGGAIFRIILPIEGTPPPTSTPPEPRQGAEELAR
jgi:two-component system sensor histidine kinase KdpD